MNDYGNTYKIYAISIKGWNDDTLIANRDGVSHLNALNEYLTDNKPYSTPDAYLVVDEDTGEQMLFKARYTGWNITPVTKIV